MSHRFIQGLWDSNDRGFAETIVQFDLVLRVAVGEITGRSLRNRFNVADVLQNESILAAYDVNRVALHSLFSQLIQVRFGVAESEGLKFTLNFCLCVRWATFITKVWLLLPTASTV